MSQVGERRRGREGQAGGRSRYLDILRLPGALAFSGSAFVGRMSMSMYGLGTVLLIVAVTGRYGPAGTVAATGSLGYALSAPVVAALSDRFGQRPVLLRQAAVFAASATAFIASAQLRAPLWLLLATGTLAGASMPSLGGMVRSRWSALLSGEPRRLQTAFALESVNDELIFVVGPAVVTLLATQWLPASGVAVASMLAAAGTLLFALQRRTEPGPRRARGGRDGDVPRAGLPSRRARRRMPGRPSLPAAGLTVLAPVFLVLGAMFSAIDLSTVAFASQLGHRPVAGLVLGSYAVGSAAGGLWYGSRHWRAPLGRRLVITMALTAAGVCTFWSMPGLLALAAVGCVTSMSVAPTLIAGYAILERQAPARRRTEAMSWLSSTVSVGVALGSAVAGRLIDLGGARLGFGCAAAFGVASALVCLAGRSRLATPPGTPGAPIGPG